VEKVADIVGLYLDPPAGVIVLSVDLQATPELLEAAADRLENTGQDAGYGARR
jgi:hypothetical protein